MSGDGPLTPRRMPSSFDDTDEQNKPALQRIGSRLIREPLIPIGCALTVAAFTNAWLAMRKGDHARVQRMFRARVMAQGFTVLAMVAGGLYFADERHRQRELWKLEREREAEEKRQKWIRELELRDEEDKAVKEILKKKKQRRADVAVGMVEAAAKRAAGAENTVAEEPPAVMAGQRQNLTPVVAEDKEGQSSILGAISRIFGGGSSQQARANATPMEDTQAGGTVSPGTKK